MSKTHLYILFGIFLLNLPKQWKIAIAAAIDYNDYNYLETANKDFNDYLENVIENKKSQPLKDKFKYTEKRNSYEPNYSDDSYPSECKPSLEMTTQSITTISSSPQDNSSTTYGPATTTTTNTTGKPNEHLETSDNDALKEAQDVIDHITHLIKSMREHAIALIKNMNELETDILSSNYTDIDKLMDNTSRNATNYKEESSIYGIKKTTYPDILSQIPGYVINKWSAPVKTDVPGTQQTNEFMDEAQAAVRSWKHEIENCKRILDGAVSKALETSNLRSNLISDTIGNPSLKTYSADGEELFGQRKLVTPNHKMAVNPPIYDLVQPTRELKQLDKFKKVRSNGLRKYNGLYEALHSKIRGY